MRRAAEYLPSRAKPAILWEFLFIWLACCEGELSKARRIRDPVHDLIPFGTDKFEQMAWKLLELPEFQRLRRIKQLGFSELVFPGATRYAVFSSTHSSPNSAFDVERRKVLDILKNYSTVEVELAATTDFLKRNGYEKDPWAETSRRKAAKVNDVRIERSKQLLRDLSLI